LLTPVGYRDSVMNRIGNSLYSTRAHMEKQKHEMSAALV